MGAPLTKCARCLGRGSDDDKRPGYTDPNGDDDIGSRRYPRNGAKRLNASADPDASATSTAMDEFDSGEVGIELINKDRYFEGSDFEYYRNRLKNEWKHALNEESEINWQPGDYLGHGTFGTVILGLRDSGELLAVKQVILVGGNQNDRIKSLEQEIEVLRSLSHKNIVKYVGTSRDRNHLNIFLEYIAGGTIAGLIKKYGKFQENLIRIYTKQILEGLEYLHAHNVIHRDIKGGNVLVDRNGICKLADFGTAKRFLDDSEINNSLTGTANWMAPEVINQTGHGRKADIWSVGCTVVEMATAKPPFSQFKSQMAALLNIARASEPPQLPSDLSPELKDFILLCFLRVPAKRPNVRKLLEHPFILGLKLGEKPPVQQGMDPIKEDENEDGGLGSEPSPKKKKSKGQKMFSAIRDSVKKLSNQSKKEKKEKKATPKLPKAEVDEKKELVKTSAKAATHEKEEEEAKEIDAETTNANSEILADDSLLMAGSSHPKKEVKSEDLRTKGGNMIVTVMELKNESMETEGIETEQSRLEKDVSKCSSRSRRIPGFESEITETAQEDDEGEALQRFQSNSSYGSNLTHMESVFRQGTMDVMHMGSMRSNTQELAHLDSQELGYYALQAPFGFRDAARKPEVTKDENFEEQQEHTPTTAWTIGASGGGGGSRSSRAGHKNPSRTIEEEYHKEEDNDGKKENKSARREKKEGENLLDSSSSEEDDDDNAENGEIKPVPETRKRAKTRSGAQVSKKSNAQLGAFGGKAEGENLFSSSSSSYEDDDEDETSVDGLMTKQQGQKETNQSEGDDRKKMTHGASGVQREAPRIEPKENAHQSAGGAFGGKKEGENLFTSSSEEDDYSEEEDKEEEKERVGQDCLPQIVSGRRENPTNQSTGVQRGVLRETPGQAKETTVGAFGGKGEGENLLSSSSSSDYEESEEEEAGNRSNRLFQNEESDATQKVIPGSFSDNVVDLQSLSARKRKSGGSSSDRSGLYREMVVEEEDEELDQSPEVASKRPNGHVKKLATLKEANTREELDERGINFGELSRQESDVSRPLGSLTKSSKGPQRGFGEPDFDDINSVSGSESSRAAPTTESRPHLRELGSGDRSDRSFLQKKQVQKSERNVLDGKKEASPSSIDREIAKETEEHDAGEDNMQRSDPNLNLVEQDHLSGMKALKLDDNLTIPKRSHDNSGWGSPAKSQVRSFISAEFSHNSNTSGGIIASDSSVGEPLTKDRVLAFERLNRSSSSDSGLEDANDDIEVISYGKGRSSSKREKSPLLEGLGEKS